MIEEQGRVVNHHRVMVYLKYFRASYLDVLLSVTCNALRAFFRSLTTTMSACGNPALLDFRERHRGFNSARSHQVTKVRSNRPATTLIPEAEHTQ